MYATGLRTEKSVNGVPTKYIYLGGKVAFETTGIETIHYTYDGSGAPFSMTYNGSEYFYLRNLQGDVTGLADAAGAAVGVNNQVKSGRGSIQLSPTRLFIS